MGLRSILFGTMMGMATFSGGAMGQCVSQWDTQFGHVGSGVTGGAFSQLVTYDDGSGPALFASGQVSVFEGSISPLGLFKFQNGRWTSLGDGVLYGAIVGQGPQCLATWDQDGSGPQRPYLVVGGALGEFASNNITLWDGQFFSNLPDVPFTPYVSNGVFAAASYQAPGELAPRLYVAGSIGNADSTLGIAVWNGSQWRSPGPWGLLGSAPTGRALFVFDDGSGPQLYMGGQFPDFSLGIAGTANIARWNGTNWSSVGGGRPPVNSIPSYDYVGQIFSFDDDEGGPHLAKLCALSTTQLSMWDGASWTSYPIPNSDQTWRVGRCAVVHEAGGPVLYYAGMTPLPPYTPQFLRFNGTGFVPASNDNANVVGCSLLGVADTGNGPQLFATCDRPTGSILQDSPLYAWTGAGWTDAGGDPAPQLQSRPQAIHALKRFDPDGAGPAPAELFAGGFDPRYRAFPAVSKWNGELWTPVTAGLLAPWIDRFAVSTTGTPTLYAEGPGADVFNGPFHVYRLDGSAWTPLGGGAAGFDSGRTTPLSGVVGGSEELFAFGEFSNVGATPLFGLAHWNGSSWQQVGTGVTPLASTTPPGVQAAIQAGSLFITGLFSEVGGIVPPARVARWDGEAWSDASAGLPPIPSPSYLPPAYAFSSIGGQLYAFNPAAGGAPMYRWNGSAWASAAASFPSGKPLGTADLGGGERLYLSNLNELGYPVLCSFDPLTNTLTPKLDMGDVVGSNVFSVERFDVGGQVSLCVGGEFEGVGGNEVFPGVFATPVRGIPSPGLARWFCPAPACPADFNHSGGITVQDIFDFLGAYFAGSPSADINGAGGVTVQDIFDFLSRYFGGC